MLTTIITSIILTPCISVAHRCLYSNQDCELYSKFPQRCNLSRRSAQRRDSLMLQNVCHETMSQPSYDPRQPGPQDAPEVFGGTSMKKSKV